MTHPLQQLVFPNLAFGTPEEMYVRAVNRQCIPQLNQKTLRFMESGVASFDTYFNALTVHTWKQHCTIDTLSLILSGEGTFILRFGLHRMGHASRWLHEQTIELESNTPLTTELKFWEELEAGLLYFSLTALTDGTLNSGGFYTTTHPINPVKLGIVITHFNRKPYVLPAIKRIQEELLADSDYEKKITLVVVDNSKNITKEETPGATVIPNKNLGGSGGFMRGLLHLKDHAFTHCLFMDDDASCEVESIRRTFALFQFSKTPKMALAGSLLREVEPFRLFEKGAQFDGLCRPINSGLDMRIERDLVMAEINDKVPDYGGWWFFSFRISDINFYSFPFFIRGDDSLFSLTNQFSILTMNGITSWGDDFALKSTPLTTYLDARYHLLHSMTHLHQNKIFCIKLLLIFSFTRLFSYNYASSKAINKAIEHVLEGPDFWIKNMDLSNIRKEINALEPSEKLHPVHRPEYNVEYAGTQPERLRTLARWLTLNGFLLPSFLLKDKTLFQHKGFRGLFREVYRYKQVLYEYEPQGIGYIATHDKKEFFTTLFSLLKVLAKLASRFTQLRADYTNKMPEMMNENFWRQVYSKGVDSNRPAKTNEGKQS
jgi:hypothetical protein